MINTIDLKARKENIYLMRTDGMTFQSIADLYGISSGRVRQIFDRNVRDIQCAGARRITKAKAIVDNNEALRHGDALALADYLRHKVSVNNPKDQYFLDEAAKTIEKLQKRINLLQSSTICD
jgi:hypothetical protein